MLKFRKWFKRGLKIQKLQKQYALKGRVGQNLRKFSNFRCAEFRQ